MTQTLNAHSIAEIQFFLLATPCEQCGRGPLTCRTDLDQPPSEQMDVEACCEECAHEHRFRFQVADDAPTPDRDDLYPVISTSDAPSQILDVGQWIMLSQLMLEQTKREPERIEARRLEYQAGQCLQEAIKFYDDNDLPPDSAIFVEDTRRRRRAHPEMFSRQHLCEMRAKLPQAIKPDRSTERGSAAAPWWKFW